MKSLVSANSIEPLIESVKPKGGLGWVAAIIACGFVGNALFTGAAAVTTMMMTDDSPLAEVFDYRPPHIQTRQGDPVTVSYFYTRRDCDAIATFSINPVESPESRVYNFGPFVATSPPTEEPRWITMTTDIGSENIPVGEYTLTYFMEGRCEAHDGLKASSKEIFHQGPVIPLTILPAKQ